MSDTPPGAPRNDDWIDALPESTLAHLSVQVWRALVDAVPLESAARQIAARAGLDVGSIEWRTGGTAWQGMLEQATLRGQIRELLRVSVEGKPPLSRRLREVLDQPTTASLQDPIILRDRQEVEQFARRLQSVIVFHAGLGELDVLVPLARWREWGPVGRAELLGEHAFPEQDPCVVFYKEGVIVERVDLNGVVVVPRGDA